jgi:hypothetical protein
MPGAADGTLKVGQWNIEAIVLADGPKLGRPDVVSKAGLSGKRTVRLLPSLARRVGLLLGPKSKPQAPIVPNAPIVRLQLRENAFESDGTPRSGDTTKRPRDTDGRFQEPPCYS